MIRKAEDLLRQKTAQLAAVREISRAIAEARDLDGTLDLITRRTTEVMHVDSCSIYLYTKENDQLILAASTGLNKTVIGHMALPRGGGLTGWAAEHARTVAVADASADPRFYRMIGSGESRYASLMAMPLIAGGKVIGAANVQTLEHHLFSTDEVELFSFITDLAATAIEKAKLVHAAVVQEIHHRVKNNLQTIAMLLRLQVAQAENLSPENILHETISRVLSIAAVHEILAQEHQSLVQLKQLVKQVTRIVAGSMILPGQLNISVTGQSVELSSHTATRLALITNELIQNSLEHSLRNQHQGEIIVDISHNKNTVSLTVTDNGQGLPADFNLKSDHGLGLELVQTMVIEDMDGTFTLQNHPNGGTIATVCVAMNILTEQTSHDREKFI